MIFGAEQISHAPTLNEVIKGVIIAGIIFGVAFGLACFVLWVGRDRVSTYAENLEDEENSTEGDPKP